MYDDKERVATSDEDAPDSEAGATRMAPQLSRMTDSPLQPGAMVSRTVQKNQTATRERVPHATNRGKPADLPTAAESNRADAEVSEFVRRGESTLGDDYAGPAFYDVPVQYRHARRDEYGPSQCLGHP